MRVAQSTHSFRFVLHPPCQANVGPMFGQFNHFTRYAPESIEYAKTRYTNEVKRLLKVLDTQLGRTGKYIAGEEYTIADIATWPWIHVLVERAKEIIPITESTYPNVARWYGEIAKRPAVIKGLTVLPM
jgi:GST-like protein